MLEQKWTGTDIDRREMRALDLKQVVRRNFGMLSMFGFASTLLCTWETLSATIGVALSNGGTAGLFWNYIIAAVGLGFVYASIAELASMFPTSGGQYYWVAIMAPRGSRRYLSYITGWLCTITWQTSIAACAFVSGTMMQGLFVLNYESYVYESWHGSLLTLVYILVAVAFNTLLARKLPILEGIFVFLHILGILIFIPVWVLSPRRQGGSPIVDFSNPGGWVSDGFATMVGTTGVITTLIGFDCSVHMAEESKDSSRTVPFTLLSGYATNVILGFFAIMTCIYTLPSLDLATTLAPATGYPIISLFFAATNSLAATNFMTAVLIFNFNAGCIASLAAASRQLWAFARNRGVPFSHFFAPDQLEYDIPLNAVLFSLIIPAMIALLNIGSTLVLGILLSIFVSALVASYSITIGCMLLHRLQGRELPHARYSLGKWGVFTNIVALLYIAPIFVFSFFPSTSTPTPATMNWAVVMVTGPIIFATIYYIVWGRKTYTPPNETVEDYIERTVEESPEKEMSRTLDETKMGAEESVTHELAAEESLDAAEKRD